MLGNLWLISAVLCHWGNVSSGIGARERFTANLGTNAGIRIEFVSGDCRRDNFNFVVLVSVVVGVGVGIGCGRNVLIILGCLVGRRFGYPKSFSYAICKFLEAKFGIFAIARCEARGAAFKNCSELLCSG